MINITINTQLIEFLREREFYPDTMFSSLIILKALNSGDIMLLDKLDDRNKSKRVILIYIDLIRKGLIEEDMDGTVFYKLTPKGKVFIDALDAIETGKKAVDDVDAWFPKWMELWPKGVKSGGKLLRSDAKSCLIKMKKFIKDYPQYDRKTIMRATYDYLTEHESKDYQFTRCAIYFINRQGEGSDLAARCQEVLDNKSSKTETEIQSSNNFFI